MTGMHHGFAAFAEELGSHACSAAKKTVKSVSGLMQALSKCVKQTLAPVGKDTSVFLKKLIRHPVSAIGEKKEGSAQVFSQFKRRLKMFGIKRTFFLHYKENRLAAKRRGSCIPRIVNVVFPTTSIAVLVLTVSSVMSTDYGVAVEYDGEQIGVVSGEEVLSEAQCVVADRIKYYDTNGDYYVTASLAITPLSASDDIIDETALAANMEDMISRRFDEKPEEVETFSLPEEQSSLIKAYSVRVDGEFIGAVEGYSEIEAALNALLAPYDNGEYTEIGFDKRVVYDHEEYVEPEQIVSQQYVIDILTGYESQPEYYEVQPGDYLIKIAEDRGMTLPEIASCYATYNGKVIEDLEHSILKAGTLILIQSEQPYLGIECKREATFRADIPFETIVIEDPEMPEGQVQVETQGVNGEKRLKALVTYREGVAVKKKVLETEVITEPVSEIIRMGTAVNGVINYDVPEFVTGTGNGEYIWPVGGGYISAHQGDNRGHKGIDIAAPYGTPIYAAASGTVISANTGWNGGYGNCIVIQNDDGKETWYAHQAELAAAEGDVVEAGQLIGYVGSTGDSTGNHLHFEVRLDGKYLDPEEYVAQ